MPEAPATIRPVEPEAIDAIMCVGPGPVGVALAAITGLRGFTGVGSITVLAAPDAAASLGRRLAGASGVQVRDEREVTSVLDRGAIESSLSARGADPRRAGWYLQQFLKLAVAAEPGSRWRLAWDGDTLPLRTLRFLTDEASPRPLLAPRGDRHEPYFRTIVGLLGEGPFAGHSFIHEHLMLRQDLAAAMLDRLAADRRVAWSMRVLEAIAGADLLPSGFSEFETYGTFVHRLDPTHFAIRPLRSIREAMVRLGPTPTAANLLALARRHDLATFESRHRGSRRGRWRRRLGVRALGRWIDAWTPRSGDVTPTQQEVLSSMAEAMRGRIAPAE